LRVVAILQQIGDGLRRMMMRRARPTWEIAFRFRVTDYDATASDQTNTNIDTLSDAMQGHIYGKSAECRVRSGCCAGAVGQTCEMSHYGPQRIYIVLTYFPLCHHIRTYQKTSMLSRS